MFASEFGAATDWGESHRRSNFWGVKQMKEELRKGKQSPPHTQRFVPPIPERYQNYARRRH